MVMGPVAKPSGEWLGTPAYGKERTNDVGWMAGFKQFANAVMVALARRTGQQADETFKRAYCFDAARHGWRETPWGSALVARLFADRMDRDDPGVLAATALSRTD